MSGGRGERLMMRNQRGITILGFLFVAVVVVTVALAVQKALQQALEDSPTGNVAEIRRNFDRKTSAGYIESVQPNDVQVTRQNNQITAAVSWQRVLPMIANASILLDFDATASR